MHAAEKKDFPKHLNGWKSESLGLHLALVHTSCLEFESSVQATEQLFLWKTPHPQKQPSLGPIKNIVSPQQMFTQHSFLVTNC